MNVKAVVLDIDNTLTAETDHIIPESAIRACKELQEKGILVIIATGRALCSLSSLDNAVYPDYYIGCGGAVIKDKNRKTIWESIYSKELYDEITDYCYKENIGMLWKFEIGAYGINNDPFWQKLVDDGEQIIVGLGDVGDCLPNSFSFECSKEKCEQFIIKYKENLNVCDGGHYVYDVEQNGINKGSCLVRLSKMINIGLDQMIAFGDSENDLSIMATCGYSVAVGNAMESVKKKADYVSEKASEDGVEKALKNLGIL